MGLSFEELGFRATPIGDLSLRRRRELSLGVDVIEIKLGDEFLMSSLFTVSEIALADLALKKLDSDNLDIVVGGLGLGYTAQAVLQHKSVGSLVVVDALEAVIDWHQSGLLPLGPELTADKRCKFQLGDFFALSASSNGFDQSVPSRKYDAILVDIDHSPEFLLNAQNGVFYQPAGLKQLASHLKPGGIFGLWSNDLADDVFTERLDKIFAKVWAEPVTFHNPLQDKDFTQTVYLAQTAS
ncbi:MAG: spermidine synthase [Hyphomicrobiales bacterium]|nr:spermidine synthase [Hyphomicrobiales bacterium]PCJ83627.1 MAG: spermidine synthase [Hyphomicrobiales bacterium]